MAVSVGLVSPAVTRVVLTAAQSVTVAGLSLVRYRIRIRVVLRTAPPRVEVGALLQCLGHQDEVARHLRLRVIRERSGARLFVTKLSIQSG
jgi:hypothetical protein